MKEAARCLGREVNTKKRAAISEKMRLLSRVRRYFLERFIGHLLYRF